MKEKIRAALLWLAKPFLVWISGKHLPYTHKLIKGRDYYYAHQRVRPGDIFVTRILGEFTTPVTPGFWTHAAIYAPEDGAVLKCVVEAEGPGVIETDLVSFLLSKDYAMILRPYNTNGADRALVAALARQQLGKPYDYQFEFKQNGGVEFYCSELVWWCYNKSCGQKIFKPRTSMGVETLLPDDIAQQCKIIWDSRRGELNAKG